MLHKGIEIRSTLSRISLAEILSRPVALDLDNLFKREKILLLQGRLSDKIGLLCDKLCDFFRSTLHCFTRFQRRKTT